MHVFSCGGASITVQIHLFIHAVNPPLMPRSPYFTYEARGPHTQYVLHVDERGGDHICQKKVVPQLEGGDRPS